MGFCKPIPARSAGLAAYFLCYTYASFDWMMESCLDPPTQEIVEYHFQRLSKMYTHTGNPVGHDVLNSAITILTYVELRGEVLG